MKKQFVVGEFRTIMIYNVPFLYNKILACQEWRDRDGEQQNALLIESWSASWKIFQLKYQFKNRDNLFQYAIHF